MEKYKKVIAELEKVGFCKIERRKENVTENHDKEHADGGSVGVELTGMVDETENNPYVRDNL